MVKLIEKSQCRRAVGLLISQPAQPRLFAAKLTRRDEGPGPHMQTYPLVRLATRNRFPVHSPVKTLL